LNTLIFILKDTFAVFMVYQSLMILTK